jgi:hypothetical protein
MTENLENNSSENTEKKEQNSIDTTNTDIQKNSVVQDVQKDFVVQKEKKEIKHFAAYGGF